MARSIGTWPPENNFNDKTSRDKGPFEILLGSPPSHSITLASHVFSIGYHGCLFFPQHPLTDAPWTSADATSPWPYRSHSHTPAEEGLQDPEAVFGFVRSIFFWSLGPCWTPFLPDPVSLLSDLWSLLRPFATDLAPLGPRSIYEVGLVQMRKPTQRPPFEGLGGLGASVVGGVGGRGPTGSLVCVW
ncbi:hypothetical protein BD289DRAFT_434113 [Coniella lustricola]|uniref:Uncharacterized protein n=1 Tax=Coniella lustricola TaxID=2025994 RepID=A0A2T3A7T0_9PEZI|nr:hypothetical protein BD289DRAFT_434113 [Coniella lustricola]